MAAGNNTLATVTNLLKTKYDQKMLEFMAYQNEPFLGNIRKDRNFGGNNARITLGYGDPQGGSADFATAIANKTSSADAGYLLTRTNDFHIGGIDGDAIDAGEGEENTVYDVVKRSVEGSMRQITRSLEIGVFGNGGGSRGQISAASVITTPTITLTDISQIVNFEVGMKLQASAGDGTAVADVLRNGGNTVTIAAVNRDLGTITVVGNWNAGIAAIAPGDSLFRAGDFKLSMKGLSAWLPLVAPTSGDNFFGVDRSVDVTRLAGCRYTGTGSKEETLARAAARVQREGGKSDLGLVNSEDYADICLSLGSKAIYDPVKSSDGVFSFQALKLQTPMGAVPITGSINVKRGEFYLLQKNTWVLKSKGGAPKFLMEDGLKMLRQSSADAYEYRLGYRAQLGCEAAGYNLHGTY